MNIHENVTIPGALQTLQNLLRSGDDEGAKALIAELDISWASKAEQVDQTSLVKDDLSTSLVPDDICGKALPQGLRTVACRKLRSPLITFILNQKASLVTCW